MRTLSFYRSIGEKKCREWSESFDCGASADDGAGIGAGGYAATTYVDGVGVILLSKKKERGSDD